MIERLIIILLYLYAITPIGHIYHKIKLIQDLEIKEPESIILNHPVDIAADSKNNIYVLDNKEKFIYKFSDEGKFIIKIGGPGQGPGEFASPCSIYIDIHDIIHVLDSGNRRIEVFDIKGKYIKSIKIIDFPESSGNKIIVDKSGKYYVSGYFKTLNSMMALYSSTGERLKSFPLPAMDYQGPISKNNLRESAKDWLSGGSLCFVDEDKIAFSYHWPYLVKYVSLDGETMNQVSGKSSHNWTPMIFENVNSGIFFVSSTRTCKIFLLSTNYVVDSFSVVDWEGDPGKKVDWAILMKNAQEYFKIKKRYAVLDFFTKEGEFAASAEMEGRLDFLTSDKKGRVLGIKYNEEDIPSIIRYKVEF